MSLGNMEERTKGMRKRAQELIEQAYQRGYKAGYEEGRGQTWSEEVKKYEIEPEKARKYIEQGRTESWAAAQKILDVCNSVNKVLDKVFGTPSVSEIMHTCTPSQAIEKLNEYEEWKKQQDDEEIKVGDEIVTVAGDKGVVTGISNNDVYLFTSGWKIPQVRHKLCCKRTGRTFPEIAEVLDKISDSE